MAKLASEALVVVLEAALLRLNTFIGIDLKLSFGMAFLKM